MYQSTVGLFLPISNQQENRLSYYGGGGGDANNNVTSSTSSSGSFLSSSTDKKKTIDEEEEEQEKNNLLLVARNNSDAENNTTTNNKTVSSPGRLRFVIAIVGSIAILLAVAVIILSLLLGAEISKCSAYYKQDQAETCTTLECISHASSMLRYMNTSADPCEDFFEYACGRFDRIESIPPGKSRATQFTILTDRNAKIMRSILERPLDSFVNEAQRKAKQFYDSCMNMNSINAAGASAVQGIVSQFGGFLLSTNSTVPDNWSLTKQLITRNLYSTSGFFSFSVGQDDKNSSRNLMSMDQGGIGLPSRDYYLNKSVDTDPILNAYATFLEAIATRIVNAKKPTTKPSPLAAAVNGRGRKVRDVSIENDGEQQQLAVDIEQVKDVVRLEQEIARILASSAERRQWDKMYSLLTTDDLQRLCPSIDWREFFETITKSSNINGLPTDDIIVYGKNYFGRLHTLLTAMNTTRGQKVLHNYIVFRTILKFIPQLSTEFRDIYETFQSVMTGKKGSTELWETCVMDTSDMLGFAIGGIYINEHFSEVARSKSEEMIGEIRNAFKQRINELPWMGNVTKSKALEKADAMRYNIGYPEWCANETTLNAYYDGFNVTDENLQNHVNYFRYALGRMLKRLREPPDPSRWSMVPMQVNAYYTASQNKIVFPAGILQPPFFSDAVPSALNFGGIGMVIGHEIVHAFDDTGRLFFKSGELLSWWDNVTDAQFRTRTKCIANQYSRYQSSGLFIRGNQTVGENIADNGGIKVAFQAYKALQAKQKETRRETRLPGINLNEDQLFFVNFAQIWCAVYTPEALRHQIMSNAHTPSQFRVLGTASNSQDFSRAFNCPEKTPMNPHERCEIW